MSIVIRNTIRGAIKLNGLVERECFSSWQAFLERLPDLVSIELPENAGGVIAQTAEPSEDDRGKIWLRLDGSGGFIAPYAFQDGKWQPLYTYAEDDVIWKFGNSTQVKRGFQLIDTGDELLPSELVKDLKLKYITGSGGGFYSFYAVRYVGF